MYGGTFYHYCLFNALDRPSNQFFPSVSLCVCEQIGCPQFFADFYEILHAAKKCGRIDAYIVCVTCERNRK